MLSLLFLPVLLIQVPLATSYPFPITAQTTASPVPYDWTSTYLSEFTIHSSCNATERHELTEGLRQAVEMAEHAKNHVLTHGATSQIYRKYFGDGPTGPVIGGLEKIASANRAEIIFRCDDPNENCKTQSGWAGHYRGLNATSETVICSLSYLTRLPLIALCARGFSIATGRPADFWHRIYHVPLVGEETIDHHADGYHDLLELARGENYTLAARNSASLTYFATDAYAYDVSVPGEGCVGREREEEGEGSSTVVVPTSVMSAMAASSTVAAASVTTINPTRIVMPSESTGTPAGNEGLECHTHADGTEHCV